MKNPIRYLLLFCSAITVQASNIFPSSGNVGIGVSSPQEKLHVNGASYLRGNVKIFANEGIGNDGTAYLQARDNSGASDIGMQFRTQENGNYINVLRLSYDGDVGIGTSNPRRKLHVAGNTYLRGHMSLYAYEGDGQSGTSYIQARDDSGNSSISIQLRTQENGSYRNVMRLNANGYVGIGTGLPTKKLHVAGDTQSHKLTLISSQDVSKSNKNGTLMIGDVNGINVSLDNNEIMARNGVNNTTLHLNAEGGNIRMGNTDTKVGIGTSTPDYPLDVNGTIRAKEVIVESGWSDYVFEDTASHRSPKSKPTSLPTATSPASPPPLRSNKMAPSSVNWSPSKWPKSKN